MTTLEDLVQEVTLALQGYCTKSEQVTYLKVDIDEAENRIKVDDIDQVSRGVVEIGDELIRVEATDRANSVAICLPRGRGWRGTTAAAHTADDTVTMAPLVPRVQIKRAINDTIEAVYPTLFGVAEATITVDDSSQMAWGVPADAEAILDVRWRDLFDDWQRVRHWELENRAATGDFPTGKALRVKFVPANHEVQVVYATRPTRMTDVSTFADTGLDESVREMVVLGAVSRLLPALDVARLSVKTVNPDELDQPVQLGSAVSIARELRRDFRERLAEERDVLLKRFPGRVHYTR
jgi:hypothetical protein